jgi:hypothetical protein
MVESDGLPVVHTSDLIAYRRCRRKWDLGSYMRQNLEPIRQSSPLLFGTAFHFACEDQEGLHHYASYAEAFLKFWDGIPQEERPHNWEELRELGVGMFTHYQTWLQTRNIYPTLWLNETGVNPGPQVEVHFKVPILDVFRTGRQIAWFEGKFDRVVYDAEQRLWLMEYKTARQFNVSKLDLDFQSTAYTWAAQWFYHCEVEGVIYTQFAKAVPHAPSVLKNGVLSVNKNQRTTYGLFMKAIRELHGDGPDATAPYQHFLNYLLESETPEGNDFILRTLVRRNENELASFYENLVLQTLEMLSNPPLYPNPTSDCSWDCDFKPVCLAMNDGSDWQFILDQCFRKRPTDDPLWRIKLEKGEL